MQEMIPLMNKNRICYRVIRRSHRFFPHEMAGGDSRGSVVILLWKVPYPDRELKIFGFDRELHASQLSLYTLICEMQTN